MKHSQDNGDKNNYLSRLQKFAEANKHLVNTPKVKIPDTPPAPVSTKTETPSEKKPAPSINIKWKKAGAMLIVATFFMSGYEIAKGAFNSHFPQSIGALPKPWEESITSETPDVVVEAPVPVAPAPETPAVVVATPSINGADQGAPVIPAVVTNETSVPVSISPNASWSWCFTNNFAGSSGDDSIALECGVQAYNTSEGLYVTTEFETGFVTSYLIGVNGQSTTYINNESFESRYYIVTHENREYYEFQSNGLTQWIPIHSIEASIL